MAYVERITQEEYWDLQERFGGKMVLRRGGEVLLSADTYEELSKLMEGCTFDWDETIIQSFDPPDQVRVL
jgi:hypothetical protein